VAFVDDGARVVILALQEPPNRPQLLTGAAALVWRALDTASAPAQLTARLTTELLDGTWSKDDARDLVQSVLRLLAGEGLISVGR
jgi:hypothetical protein